MMTAFGLPEWYVQSATPATSNAGASRIGNDRGGALRFSTWIPQMRTVATLREILLAVGAWSEQASSYAAAFS